MVRIITLATTLAAITFVSARPHQPSRRHHHNGVAMHLAARQDTEALPVIDPSSITAANATSTGDDDPSCVGDYCLATDDGDDADEVEDPQEEEEDAVVDEQTAKDAATTNSTLWDVNDALENALHPKPVPEPGSFAALFPAGEVKDGDGWTVASKGIPGAQVIDLTDNTFIVNKQSKGLSRKVVTVDGRKAIHANFKKGAYTLRQNPPGGFSFYTPGPKGKDGKPVLDVTKAKELSLSYSIKFSKGYGWRLGGKLPGTFGGENDSVAASCSGGRHDEGCFSTRFMWRQNGKGELYLYLPPSQNRNNLCGKDGKGKCHGASSNGKTYGASIGTGLWNFKDGSWVTVRQVIHLNTPGKRDGWAKVFINGNEKPVLNVQEISFRRSKKSVFRGIQMQTFHGGHDPNWSAPHDQDIWFSDFSVVITEYDN